MTDQDVPLVAAHDEPGPDGATPGEQDRRVLRRALRAGVGTGVVLAALLGLANLLFGGGGAAALVWVMASVVVGALVTAGWLVLVLLLDLIAGELPTRRRVVWTLIAFAVAFVSPVLPAAALLAAAEGAG